MCLKALFKFTKMDTYQMCINYDLVEAHATALNELALLLSKQQKFVTVSLRLKRRTEYPSLHVLAQQQPQPVHCQNFSQISTHKW